MDPSSLVFNFEKLPRSFHRRPDQATGEKRRRRGGEKKTIQITAQNAGFSKQREKFRRTDKHLKMKLFKREKSRSLQRNLREMGD